MVIKKTHQHGGRFLALRIAQAVVQIADYTLAELVERTGSPIRLIGDPADAIGQLL
jgi:hypothetical protein